RQKALREKLLPERHAIGVVHREDFDGRSPHGCSSHKERPFPPEVARPPMPPRIEQPCELLCLRVYPRKIRALVKIAPKAAIRSVPERITATVLLCNDVFKLKGSKDVGFGEVTVFAAPGRPPADFLADVVHPWNLAGFSS